MIEPNPSAGRWRALVVDDEPWVRELMREVLEGEGFEVLQAASGKSAARLLRDTPAITLIIADILMPDEDGLELIREIRRITGGRASRPKILAISGGGIFARPDLFLSIARNLGADLSLAKPFTDASLREALHRLGFSPLQDHGRA